MFSLGFLSFICSALYSYAGSYCLRSSLFVSPSSFFWMCLCMVQLAVCVSLLFFLKSSVFVLCASWFLFIFYYLFIMHYFLMCVLLSARLFHRSYCVRWLYVFVLGLVIAYVSVFAFLCITYPFSFFFLLSYVLLILSYAWCRLSHVFVIR